MSKLAYYMCAKCQKPYFGGLKGAQVCVFVTVQDCAAAHRVRGRRER
jgi:hypothetical protein